MSWHWHAAHIVSSQQSKIMDFALETTHFATKGNLFQDNQESSQIAYGGGRLLCISPEENSYITIWGFTPRFCALLFERHNLSGILIGGDGRAHAQSVDSDCWFYFIWKNGRIVDIHASNPKNLFREWSEDSKKNYILPFLQENGLAFQNNVHEINELIKNRSEIFKGSYSRISRFLKKDIPKADVQDWFSQNPALALDTYPRILAIPFSGSQYSAGKIALLSDLQKGNIQLAQSTGSSLNEGLVEDLDEAKKLERAQEILSLSFRWSKEATNSSALYEYSSSFFWG